MGAELPTAFHDHRRTVQVESEEHPAPATREDGQKRKAGEAMIARDPKTVAEALRNLWVHREQYGRVRSMVRLYGISRPALYRLEGRFLESIGQRRRPRSPRSVAAHSERLQGEEIARLKSEKARLQIQVDQLRDEKLNTLRRTQFWLIGLGLPARVIARLLRECFRVRANRTDILHRTQQYARRATQIMQEYFWPVAHDVDLDEIFIEGLPLLIASEPRGMTILKTSIESERTVATWGTFLRDLPHLCQQAARIMPSSRRSWLRTSTSPPAGNCLSMAISSTRFAA
jgi:hypothetical protein